MSTQGNRSLWIALALIPIAGLVVWLTTKIARTPEGDYRLMVIGATMALVMLLIAIAAVVQRVRR